MSTKLNFAADCTDFLKEVRNDQAPKGWALLTYAEGSMENIVTVAKGDGNADELATHLDDSKIMFALVRVVEQIDNSTTIKFVHIHFTGPNAKRIKQSTFIFLVLFFLFLDFPRLFFVLCLI